MSSYELLELCVFQGDRSELLSARSMAGDQTCNVICIIHLQWNIQTNKIKKGKGKGKQALQTHGGQRLRKWISHGLPPDKPENEASLFNRNFSLLGPFFCRCAFGRLGRPFPERATPWTGRTVRYTTGHPSQVTLLVHVTIRSYAMQ